LFRILKGYPKQLLPVMVHGVPSMHICLEFAPKLLAHYELDKQVKKYFLHIYHYSIKYFYCIKDFWNKFNRKLMRKISNSENIQYCQASYKRIFHNLTK
jgi:hypothetical protein